MSNKKRSRNRPGHRDAVRPDVRDLQKRLSAMTFGPELLSSRKERIDWFGSLTRERLDDVEHFVFGHPEEARIEYWLGSGKNSAGRRLRQLNRLLDEFSSVLPQRARELWFDVERLLHERKRLECAAYYNEGVERGLDLAVTTKALERSGVQVEGIDAKPLFALTVALSDVARRLPFEAPKKSATRKA